MLGASDMTTAKHLAITRHHVTQAQNNQLVTASLIDGLGQAIQLKKSSFENSATAGQIRWLISGKEKKDVYGRVVQAYLPTSTTFSIDNADVYYSQSNGIDPTIMSYDPKDRITSVQQPGEQNIAYTEYSISDNMFVSTVLNELGQIFETFTDVRGRNRKTVQESELTTHFYYNTIGEKLRVKNHQGYETLYTYDLAGRRLEERHSDRGVTSYEYDVVGNLIKKFTSNLIAAGQEQSIRYEYDFNRLIRVKYPLFPENNVEYIYGAVGDNQAQINNAVGRLHMQEDASGVQVFGYDELGNMDRHLKGVAVAGRHTFWFETNWNYDSFNRIQFIRYADGEVVSYNYNLGGELNNVMRTVSANVANNEPIISSIKYDYLGDRAQINYGNGTSKNYTYDDRRRLATLSHHFDNVDLANNYTYDAISNILNIQTDEIVSTLPTNGGLGGTINHTYQYDNYNRLVQADGRYTGPNDLSNSLLAQEYSLTMEYDLAHNILSKTQRHVQGAVADYGDDLDSPQIVDKTSYHLSFGDYATGVNITPTSGDEFGYVQPHAPREIIENTRCL